MVRGLIKQSQPPSVIHLDLAGSWQTLRLFDVQKLIKPFNEPREIQDTSVFRDACLSFPVQMDEPSSVLNGIANTFVPRTIKPGEPSTALDKPNVSNPIT